MPLTIRFAGVDDEPIDIVGAVDDAYVTIMLRIYIVPELCVVVVCLKLPPKCNALRVEDVVRPLTEKDVQVVVLKPVQLRIAAPPLKSHAT